jgi:predicted transcriptional regulator
MAPQREADAILAAREALGRRLAALRQAAGYSQRMFAPLTGYGRSTLASVETGHQNVPREFWLRCEEVLGACSLVDAYDEIRAMMAAERRAAADVAQAEREARIAAWRQARRDG